MTHSTIPPHEPPPTEPPHASPTGDLYPPPTGLPYASPVDTRDQYATEPNQQLEVPYQQPGHFQPATYGMPPQLEVPQKLKTVKTIATVAGILGLLAGIVTIIFSAYATSNSGDPEPARVFTASAMGGLLAIALGCAYLGVAGKIGQGVPSACRVGLWLFSIALAFHILMFPSARNIGLLIAIGLEIWMITCLASAEVKAFLKVSQGELQQ